MKVKLLKTVDFEKVYNFLEKFQDEDRDKKFWKARMDNWWEQNPSYHPGFKRGWILENEFKDIVGFIGNIPTTLISNGNIKLIHNITTWRVEKKYRIYSILLFNKILDYSKETLLFDTTPSLEVKKVLNAYNFKKFEYDKTSLILLSIKNNNSSLIKKLLLQTLSVFIDPIIFYFYKSRIKRENSDTKTKILSKKHIGSEFDIFWEKTKNQYKCTLIRDSKTIRWFMENEYSYKKLLIANYTKDKLNGFAIFIFNDSSIKSLVLVDLWILENDTDAIKLIIAKAFEFAKKNDFTRIYLHHFNKHLTKSFRQLGAIIIKSNSKSYFKHKNQPLITKNNYFTLFLGDLGL